MDHTVVILNHNGEDILLSCLEVATNQDGAEVVVLDNASTDSSADVAKTFGVEVLHADNRHQFITGLNEAFRQTDTPWVLFLQNDVLLDAHCVERLMHMTEAYGTHTIYQPILFNTDESYNHCGGQYFWPGIGRGYPKPLNKQRCYQVPLFSTACFLMHRKAYEWIGPFDVALAPAYYEDVDYSLRAVRKRIRCMVVPCATATHLSTFTFTQLHSKRVLSEICQRNRKHVVRKHTRGLDRLTRLAGLTVLDTLATGISHLHGDTYRLPPSCDWL